jgi:pimeloyl-ACP methyl ester carboxylesterase
MEYFCDYMPPLQSDARRPSGSMIVNAATCEQFRESVLALGEDRNLLAIATAPAKVVATNPTIIMLNAGVLHRVGPHRLHVVLARTLASLGFATCRVDLSGIGDSRGIANNRSFRESAVADTQALIDHLVASTGASRFVIFGLCSGADNALAAAHTDPRIDGLVLLDPPAYTTLRAIVRKFLGRAARSNPLLLGTAMVASAARLVARRMGRRRPVVSGRQLPAPHAYRKQLTALLARRKRILCVYSGALRERYNHKDQLFELFPELRQRLTVEYFAEADHIFTELAVRQRLIETVAAWLTHTYR